MNPPDIKMIEVRRDEHFIYGERWVDGAFSTEYMQPLKSTVVEAAVLTDAEKATAQKIAKFIQNDFAAILNRHKIGFGRCDPNTIRQCCDLMWDNTISKKNGLFLIEAYVLRYDLMVSCVENLSDEALRAKLKVYNDHVKSHGSFDDWILEFPDEED